MQLEEILKNFTAHIHDAAKKKELPSALKSKFDYDPEELQERLDIYRNNLYTGLANIFIVRHSTLLALVGHDFLNMLARRYIKENLPDNPNLNIYGLNFDRFLGQQNETASLPYLTDIAKMEIEAHRISYEIDEDLLDPQSLTDLNPDSFEDIHLTPKKSFSIVKSIWPIYSIHQFCMEEMSAQDNAKQYEDGASGANASMDPSVKAQTQTYQIKTNDRKFDISNKGEQVMVYRQNNDTHIEPIRRDEFSFLRALLEGNNLAYATEQALEENGSFDLGPCLKKHFEIKTFKKI